MIIKRISLQTYIVGVLMPVLFLIFFISAGVFFAKEYYEDKEIREQGIENTIKNLSDMAARALWNLEIDNANNIVKAIAQNNNISAARIKDVDNKIFTEYEKMPIHNNKLRLVIYELFIDIEYNNKKPVGYIEVEINNITLNNHLNYDLKKFFLFIFIVFALSSAFIYFMNQKIIINPSLVLKKNILEMTKNNEKFHKQSFLINEFQELYLTAKRSFMQRYRFERRILEEREIQRKEIEKITKTLIMENEKKNQLAKLATMGEMAANMAHEVNQPLNVIRLGVSNIKRQLFKDNTETNIEKLKRKCERIDKQIDRASTIIDHMRRFGRKDVENKPFKVNDVLHNVALFIDETCRLSQIELKVNVNASDFHVKGQWIHLEQVILNLVKNAQDQMKKLNREEEKILYLNVVDGGNNKIKIIVEDTGGGISEELLPKIFDPFFTTKSESEGTGLGLSISREIIQEMHGDITVSNTKRGAIFEITLPIYYDTNLFESVAS